MPLQDLQCNECKRVSEWLIRNQDLDTVGNLKTFECPYCGQTLSGYSKVFSVGTTFHLKGDGWYADGYSGQSSKNSTNSSKSPSNSE